MPVEGRLASLAGAGEWLNASAYDAQRSTLKSRPSQILDTHQLAALASYVRPWAEKYELKIRGT